MTKAYTGEKMANLTCCFLQSILPTRIRKEQSTIRPTCCVVSGTQMANNRSALPKPALLFVTPNGFCTEHPAAVAQIQEVIAAGASCIQIRDKSATEDEILMLVDELLSAGVNPSALSLNGVHPRKIYPLSRKIGVHIREADIDEYSKAVEIQKASDVVIGCSVHSVAAARLAMEKLAPTYLQVGTMFSTSSHPGKIPEGPGLMRSIREELGPSETLIGIGGINRINLRTVFEYGASGIAVISSIAAADNARKATEELVRLCREVYVNSSSSL